MIILAIHIWETLYSVFTWSIICHILKSVAGKEHPSINSLIPTIMHPLNHVSNSRGLKPIKGATIREAGYTLNSTRNINLWVWYSLLHRDSSLAL